MFCTADLKWIREPKQYNIEHDKIKIITEPNTDLWQRTYYGFQNDNAPVLQMTTKQQELQNKTKTHDHHIIC